MQSPALIGNGLYARTARGMSLLEQITAAQKKCSHATRDHRGRCYRCGQIDAGPKQETQA
jgi:hypothetical protein